MEEIGIDTVEKIDYNADWYKMLAPERKLSVFKEALHIYPYLADHMKMHGVRAREDNFTDHYSFKIMLDVLRNRK